MNPSHSGPSLGQAHRRKKPAHDRWACLDCRWSTKIPLIDSRVPNRPAYTCTHCGKRMVFTGNAFRPPRRDDEEGWIVAARILSIGCRFDATKDRQSFPTRLSEVDAWLKSKRKSWTWQRETTLSWRRTPDGDLKVRSGRRTVSDGESILVLDNGEWQEGRLCLRGDGWVSLYAPIVTFSCSWPKRVVSLTPRTRVRLWCE